MSKTPIICIVLGVAFLSLILIPGVTYYLYRRKHQLPSHVEGQFNISSSANLVDLETVPSQGDESHRDIEGSISNRVTRTEASSSVGLVKSESNSCREGQLPSSIEGPINKETTRSRASSSTGQADLRSESTQIQNITAPRAILAALIPHSKSLFATKTMKLGKDGSKQEVHINPQFRLCVEDQMVEINISEEGETIKSCLNDPRSRDPAAGAFQNSHKSVDNMDGLFIDEVGQVARVFYHEGIDKLIIKHLEDIEGISMTSLEKENWVGEIKAHIEAFCQ